MRFWLGGFLSLALASWQALSLAFWPQLSYHAWLCWQLFNCQIESRLTFRNIFRFSHSLTAVLLLHYRELWFRLDFSELLGDSHSDQLALELKCSVIFLLKRVLGIGQSLCEFLPVGLIALEVLLHLLEPAHENFLASGLIDQAHGSLDLFKSQLHVVGLGLATDEVVGG